MGHCLRYLHFNWRLSQAGGIPRFARDLLTHLDRQRFEVHAAFVRPPYPHDHLEELGDDLHLHSLKLRGNRTLGHKVAVIRGLVKLLRRVRPDILHVHDGGAWYSLLGVLLSPRIPVKILHVHDPPQARRNRIYNSWMQRLMARHLGFQTVVDSTLVQRDVASWFHLTPGEIEVLPLGTNLETFDNPRIPPGSWRDQEGIPRAQPLVLYVARLAASKNVELFLEVAGRVLDAGDRATFVVVGGGERRAVLENKIPSRHRTNVRLLGPRDDLVEALHAADLFLSTSDTEGFGLAVIEAMAAGKPVVATAVGGVLDTVVDGETGILAPRGDVDELVAAVRLLLGSAETRRRLGEAGRRRTEELYSLPAMARRYESFFLELHQQARGLDS